MGTVHPKGTKQTDYITLYAGLFHTEELNFSYYKMPDVESISKMLTDGGSSLTFAIKVHETLTSKIDAYNWEKDAKTFLEAIEPMIEAKRQEAILFQFPDSFTYSNDNRLYLDKLLKYFKGIPLAAEFQKAEWYNGRVIDAMRSREITMVSLDLPELPNLPSTIDVVTAPLAYIRFHGRNSEVRWASNKYNRYKYLYTDKEIEVLASCIKIISKQIQRILVYFNNYPYGKAVRNAQELSKLINKKNMIRLKNL